MRRVLFLACMVATIVSRAAAQQDRIYIACDDHTDYFWTADDVAYRQAFLKSLDYYLLLADSTANDPSDFQGRFACDGSLWLWEYEHNKTPREFARLISRIRDGHLSAPMTAAVSCYGGVPAEAVLRGMYYAGHLERRFGLKFDLAVAMENQTLPFGLPSLWAGAGARYSWKGICGCVSRIPDAWDREHEIYWATGPDGGRVLMKWNSMLAGNESMGGYAEARHAKAIVDYVSNDAGFQARWPWKIIGAFGKGWDDYETLTAEFVNAARAKSDASRRVIVSNELDFFQDFEAHHGAQLPTLATSFGNEWDLLCATMAEVSASVKRSLATLRTGEALATLVASCDRGFMNGRASARDLANFDLGLYWEHDWTANGPVPASVRAAWQRKLANEIADYANTLQADALTSLGRLITRTGGKPRFGVFNPLSFTRDDAADLPYLPGGPVHVVDLASGDEVPSQLFTDASGTRLRILATQVPPIGYRVYEVRNGAGKSFGDAALVDPAAGGRRIANLQCEITLSADGSIRSFVDVPRGRREFAGSINGFALNDLGGNGSGSLATENVGAVSATLVATSASPLSHVTRVTLTRDSDRVAIDDEITQNFSSVQSWRFSFALQQPNVRHEEVGAIASAHLQSGGGDYSDRAARYDWLTLNHFADITSDLDQVGCTLANLDCYFFRLGHSGVNTLDDSTPQLSPLAGGRIDGLGIQNQDGDSHFRQRFALRTHDDYDPVRAMQTALAAGHPLVAVAVTGAQAQLPAHTFQLLDCQNPGVIVWALKPADDGIDDVIVRLWNVTDEAQTTLLQLHPQPIHEARATTHLETDQGSLDVGAPGVTAKFARQQMRTLRLLRGR